MARGPGRLLATASWRIESQDLVTLDDPVFHTAVTNTAIWLVLFGGLSAVGGLGLAVLLQKERRGEPAKGNRWHRGQGD